VVPPCCFARISGRNQSQCMAFRKGDIIGSWSLVSRLGDGGNAIVWLAEDANGARVAIKVPKVQDANSVAFARFKDEVEANRLAASFEGVLPMVAFSIPDTPSADNPAWLATQVAIPMVQALGDWRLEDVLQAFTCISKALADLASKNIFHRDLKPDNLFLLGEKWVVGDFGLATFPEKATLTKNTRKLGPIYFIAPEMLNSPASANPGPADVFSLAKCIWVMATGQNYPIPGPIRVDDQITTVSSYVQHQAAGRLDVLLQSATTTDPNERLSMSSLADELQALSSPLPVAAGLPELPDYREVIQATMQPRRERDERKRHELEAVGHFVSRGGSLLRPLAEKLRASVGLEVHMSGNCMVGLISSQATGNDLYRNGNGYFVKDDASPAAILEFGIGVHAVRGEAAAYIGGAIAARYDSGQYRVVWEGGSKAVLGGRKAEQILESLANEIAANFGSGVDLFLKLLRDREEGQPIKAG